MPYPSQRHRSVANPAHSLELLQLAGHWDVGKLAEASDLDRLDAGCKADSALGSG
jgi:hypothetical protein